MPEEFQDKHLVWYQDIVEGIPSEKKIYRSETKTTVQCTNPTHDDEHPSMGVDLCQNGQGPKINIICRSGGAACEEAMPEILKGAGLTYNDLYYEKNSRSSRPKTTATKIKAGLDNGLPGCTLEAYAELKNLPIDFLEGIGLEPAKYPKYPGEDRGEFVDAVMIPYPDEDGAFDSDKGYRRYRVAVSGKDKLRGKAGMSPILYGLPDLEDAREIGYVYVVEGESDAHTLWYYGKPAVGVPGTSSFKPQWVSYFKGIDEIRVLVEPDEGGAKLWSSLIKCEGLKGRLLKVVL
jgi:hypothetical protein